MNSFSYLKCHILCSRFFLNILLLLFLHQFYTIFCNYIFFEHFAHIFSRYEFQDESLLLKIDSDFFYFISENLCMLLTKAPLLQYKPFQDRHLYPSSFHLFVTLPSSNVINNHSSFTNEKRYLFVPFINSTHFTHPSTLLCQ